MHHEDQNISLCSLSPGLGTYHICICTNSCHIVFPLIPDSRRNDFAQSLALVLVPSKHTLSWDDLIYSYHLTATFLQMIPLPLNSSQTSTLSSKSVFLKTSTNLHLDSPWSLVINVSKVESVFFLVSYLVFLLCSLL